MTAGFEHSLPSALGAANFARSGRTSRGEDLPHETASGLQVVFAKHSLRLLQARFVGRLPSRFQLIDSILRNCMHACRIQILDVS